MTQHAVQLVSFPGVQQSEITTVSVIEGFVTITELRETLIHLSSAQAKTTEREKTESCLSNSDMSHLLGKLILRQKHPFLAQKDVEYERFSE